MPDGTIYKFGLNNAIEKSAEIEATFASANNVNPQQNGGNFSQYWRSESVTSAWYLSQIQTPTGVTIDFDYRSARYSFFKLAENELNQGCSSNSVTKAVNKVYVQGVALARIRSENTQVEFNKGCTVCDGLVVDPFTFQIINSEICRLDDSCVPPRLDIDGWGNSPFGGSNAKKLVEMTVTNRAPGNEEILRYRFDYDHFVSDPNNNALPTGYSTDGAGGTTNIGTTHLKRLRLRSVLLPDGNKYEFGYHFEDAPTTFYGRLSYGVDHWGYLNGGSGVPNWGLLAKDNYNNGCASLPSRNSNEAYARYGLLAQIRLKNGDNLGMTTSFDYEAHRAQNYPDGSGGYLPIGGSRIKAISVKDFTINRTSTKRYTYLQASNGQPSGFLTMQPVYTFTPVANYLSLNSGLYERLMAETNRPAVGYSFVKEEETAGDLAETDGAGNGHSTYAFDQDPAELSMAVPGLFCGSENCDPFTYLLPQNFRPAHDFRSGNLREHKIYGSANQLVSAQYLSYTPNGGIKTDSVLAKKIFKSNGYTLAGLKYYTTFSKFRLEGDSTEIFGQNGQNPVRQSTFYTYKDQMPAAYRAQYPGRHNQVVRVGSRDGFDLPLTAHTKYTADYTFPTDSVFVQATCQDDNGNDVDCSYWLVSLHVPDASTSGAPIFWANQANRINTVVEQFQKRNNQVVGASYFDLVGQGDLSRVSVLKNAPLAAFQEASLLGDNVVTDPNYYAVSQVEAYNFYRLPTQMRAAYGPSSSIDYDASRLTPTATTQNAGVADAQTTTYQYQSKIFGASKMTAPNGLESRYDYHPDGRLHTVRDGNNHVLQAHQYFNLGQTDPSGTVGEDFVYFYRHLTRTPRIATTNAYETAPNALVSVASFTPLGSQQNARFYRQSPLANADIVSNWTTFDAFQRPIAVGLPFANNDPAVGANEYAIYNDAAPHQSVSYEATPLSRPTQSTGPGYAWRTANKKTQYASQTAGSEVRQYRVLADGSVSVASNYSNYCLVRQQTKDERGHLTQQFTDKEGRTMAQWQQDTTDQNGNPHYLKTAYVYDDAGRLRYIVPPAVYEATPNFSEADALFANGVYTYRYDGRGRVVEKHTPNAGWSYTLYNYLNQAVLTQDARQRQQNLWQWAQFDGHGRTAQTGTWTSTETRASLQSLFDNYSENQQFESPIPNGGTVRYTSRSFPAQINLSENDVKAQYFYDDYDWASSQVSFLNDAFMPRYLNSKGLLTGSKLRNTENNDWFEKAIYYDDKNRIIQTQSSNHLGGIDQMDYEYNFVGEVLKERKVYRRAAEADLTTLTTYTRDHAGRVIATTHTLNGAEKKIATYEYDDIGRLKRKKINPFEANITRTATPSNNTQDLATQWVQLLPNTTITATSTNTYVACIAPRDALQTIDYNYHIRGTVNCINCTNGMPTLNTAENDLFAIRLYFEEDGRYYNGQISKQLWLTKTDNQNRSFTYTYDQADRLKAGVYTGIGNYSLAATFYDQNGNIQNLQRFGSTGTNSWGLIDNLTYDYGSKINQLQSISDATGNANGFASAGVGAYAYWPDGFLQQDLNKGIAQITYNYLTLPQRVSFTDGRWIDFFSDAEGSKYKQVYSDGREYHYQGDVLYFKANGGAPLQIYEVQHDEGRVVSNGSALVYEYGYYDHLGNLRVSYIDSAGVAVISQQNDYDPWGVPLLGLNRASRFANANFYTFNGQERLDCGYQNMGWRWMDNLTGRMSGPDPMHQFDSDYIGLGNNPVMGTDPDGQVVPIVVGVAALIGGAMNLYKNWDAVAKTKGDGWARFAKGAAFFGLGALEGAFIAAAPGAGFTRIVATTAGKALFSGAVKSTGNVLLGGNPEQINPINILRDAALAGITAGTMSGIASVIKGGNFFSVTPKVTIDPVSIANVYDDAGKEVVSKMVGQQAAGEGSRAFEVGSYNTLRGVEIGLDAHHVGQKALMNKFVPGYNASTAPSILVPKLGHTQGVGVLSRGTSGLSNARQVLARDIFELRRVYGGQGIPNSSLQQLIQMNKTMYPGAFLK